MVYLRFVHACTSVNLIIQYDKIYESAVLWFADLILTARSSNNAHAKQTHQLATSEYPKCPDKYQGCKMFITKTTKGQSASVGSCLLDVICSDVCVHNL